MTGSVFYRRQHSSTAACSTVKTKGRPKYRRYSSVDEAHASDVMLDEIPKCEEIRLKKSDPMASDTDSGVEDLEQPIANDCNSQPGEIQEDDDDEVPTFGACLDDECVPAPAAPVPAEPIDPQEECHRRAMDDLELAARVPDDVKKEFCANTQLVFHGEFSQRIAVPIANVYPDAQYHLFTEEEVAGDPFFSANDAFWAVNNAKGQFHCPNPACGRSWTSMRSRIVFRVSRPAAYAYVVLKIFGQRCQDCRTSTDALWYMEEVCRVMKNLSNIILREFFPSLVPVEEECKAPAVVEKPRSSRKPHFDPNQRQGHMRAQHEWWLCEACQGGYCFPQTVDRHCT